MQITQKNIKKQPLTLEEMEIMAEEALLDNDAISLDDIADLF